MLIKRTEHIPAIDRKSTRTTPKKSENASEDVSFSTLLDEIDTIDLSTQKDQKKNKQKQSSNQDKNENTSKLDRFA